MKPKTRKIVSFVLITIGGIIVGLTVSFYVMLRMSVPQTNGTLALKGLSDRVKITYDSLGIAQVWANNEADAYFTLGYLHASDRLFQMDLTRRVATGRLSEMIGPATLSLDEQQRRMGHLRMAKEAVSKLDERSRKLLEAYTSGVNAYVARTHALPFEYRFLPIGFEKWKVTDCLAIFSFETWFSNALMNRDEFYQSLADKVGEKRARSLEFSYPDWAPSTVPGKGTAQPSLGFHTPGNTRQEPFEKKIRDIGFYPFRHALADAITRDLRQTSSMCYASNAWVLSPSRSQSGRAMLASDPHLELTRLPQFWYPVGIHSADSSVNVLGITAAGLPFFAMGHNGTAAWAFTAGGVKVLHHVSVRINPDDTNQYFAEGAWKNFSYIPDTFKVTGGDTTIILDQQYTIYGPVTSKERDSSEAIAVHWAGFDSNLDTSLKNAFALAGVNNFTDFREIVTGLGALDANMMYADSSGNIGYQLTTPIAKSDSSNNDFPIPASDIDSGKWSRFVPLAGTPSAYNPASGWIASCNNIPARSSFVPGYFFATRILSIDSLLQSKDKFSVRDMDRFQMSQTDRYLLRLKPELVRIARMTDSSEVSQLLEQWKGSTGKDSKATALINVYLERLRQYTFQDELGKLWRQVPSKWIENIRQVDSAGWFDDIGTPGVVESYDTIATRAMRAAVKLVNGRSWGDLQSFRMQHPMATIPILGGLLHLSTPEEQWGGTPEDLDASFYRTVADDKFESMAGPSWRFVVDFADVDSATMVIPAGVSGNPMTSHFLDFYPLWKSGGQWQVPFHQDKVVKRAASTLTLIPQDSTVTRENSN